MSTPRKEAVVFILDAHPSMNENVKNGSTRLSCAKDALEGMVSQLMIKSKENEVGVIVLNTDPVKTEDGYMDDNLNPYMTELAMPCVTKPSVALLRAIRRVECAKTDYSGADVCQGMAAAEQALRHRTFKKRYARRLVIFTDAEHKIEAAHNVILRVVDKLRELECTLTVIGVDFENSAKFDTRVDVSDAKAKSEQNDEANENGHDAMSDSDGSEETDGEEEDDDDDEEEDMQVVKSQNEELLISLARLTGGSVVAASTMKEIADGSLGKRIPKSTKRKIKFHIAPGLTLDARCSLLLSKASFPTLKKDAMICDKETKEPIRDGNGEIMTNSVKAFYDHFDPDDPKEEVTESNRTHGYRYGADYIPMSSVDKAGLRMSHLEPTIRILGYVDQSTIARSLLIGPSYGISGHASHRVCCAIAALAQALHRMEKVAICVNFKTARADPVLGALYPLQENGKTEPTRLFFMQLPFADDKRPFNMNPLEPAAEDAPESLACDNLIDAMMLPSDALRSEKIANPAIRTFHKTVKNRAVDPSSTEIVEARPEDPSLDPMSTPSELLKGASSAIETFSSTFPREEVTEEEAKAKKKKKYWTDHDD